MGLKQKAADNPTMALLTTGALIAGAVVSMHQGFQLVDKMIVTEAEAQLMHTQFEQRLTDVGTKIDSQAVLNECRWLSDKIDALGYAIYVLERDQASNDFVRSKKNDLRKHREKYDALDCVQHL